MSDNAINSAEIVRTVGEALYGSRWQTDLARDLGMSDRHVRRLASGAAELTPGMAADLLAICEDRSAAISEAVKHLRELAKG